MNIGNFPNERTVILSEMKWISIYGDNEVWINGTFKEYHENDISENKEEKPWRNLTKFEIWPPLDGEILPHS